ncbi:hypothetical protein [Paraconexibacter algicola]|uniref:Uncharacterized protein n=1 Tax=Paraconexibacter algicola TaxID=2133960 RepID=A0A2T4UH58_9ACTN|nr:hypothetical protein [Paraconexibacter algicola]PTL58570.1 hypothetical protein C7Y72_02295 [Paraconexibacter algicola]
MRRPSLRLPVSKYRRIATIAATVLGLLLLGGAVGILTAPGDPEIPAAGVVRAVPPPSVEPYIELPAIRGVRR